jgi:NitT/TauT family transport system permease protein
MSSAQRADKVPSPPDPAINPPLWRRAGRWFVQRALGPIVGIVIFGGIWESLRAVFGMPKFIIATPAETLHAAIDNWGLLMRATRVTVQETLAGFGLSIIFGVMLGLLVSLFKVVERVVYPLIIATNGFPKVALAPILVVWVGFGFSSKVIMALMTAFFPILIATIVGINSNSKEAGLLSASMGLNRLQAFLKIQLPGALPSIFGGFKVAAGLSLVGSVVGEFVASSDGLGYRLTAAMSNVNTGMLFAGLILLAIIGLILYGLTSLFEYLAVPWRRKGGR